jgi:altronate dehydratase
MDINAGEYLDGVSMDKLGNEALDLLIQTASGQLSIGEKAGHSQVQIWRNWPQTDASQLDILLNAPMPKGNPIAIQTDAAASSIRFARNNKGIGLILPTSLCSSQVAKKMAKRLNERELGQPEQLSRYVALPHTEGCGNNAGKSEQMFARTMISYATHPLVKHCLLLEHGCEKTHNDFMRNLMEEISVDPGHFGYASIQLDGGIEKATEKVEAWFADQLSQTGPTSKKTVGLESLRIGILSDGSISNEASDQLALLTKMIVGAGGTVVVPENSELLLKPAYKDNLLAVPNVQPSLAYGEHARNTGFHIMETPTDHWVETITGLAATGAELIIALVNRQPMQTHPFVPMLQVATVQTMQKTYTSDLDLLLTGIPTNWSSQILERCKQVIEQSYTPRLFEQGNVDFQITRGLLGVTL